MSKPDLVHEVFRIQLIGILGVVTLTTDVMDVRTLTWRKTFKEVLPKEVHKKC
jgi:hypothetical protein